MIKKIWKPVVLILVVGVIAADLYYDSKANGLFPEEEGPSEIGDIPVGISLGERAPDFEGFTLDGESVRLSDLRGKTVLINIFASWCAPCRLEAPHLEEVFNELGGEDVVFIGLNLQETPDAVAGFRDEFGISFPLVLNQDGRLTEIYQPIGLPTTWFIDTEGVIQYIHAGPMTADMLRQVVLDI